MSKKVNKKKLVENIKEGTCSMDKIEGQDKSIPQEILDRLPSDKEKIRRLEHDVESLEKTNHEQMLSIDKKDEWVMDAGLIIKDKDRIISDLQGTIESLKHDAKIDEVKEVDPSQDELDALKETIAKQAEVLKEKDNQINQLNGIRTRLMTALGVIKATVDLA